MMHGTPHTFDIPRFSNGSDNPIFMPHRRYHPDKHCVVCRSHNEGINRFSAVIGQRLARRNVWLARPICADCEAPWVPRACEGGCG